LVERREFEYKRHGTQRLIANCAIVTGQGIAASLGPTRTEVDCARHVAQTIALDPEGNWVFIVDQLNMHQSAALVRLVAHACGLTEELGVKGESGILRSMATRAAFSSDAPSHSVCVCAQAYVVAQSGGDLVQHSDAPGAQAW